jgi:hypothetical protein
MKNSAKTIEVQYEKKEKSNAAELKQENRTKYDIKSKTESYIEDFSQNAPDFLTQKLYKNEEVDSIFAIMGLIQEGPFFLNNNTANNGEHLLMLQDAPAINEQNKESEPQNIKENSVESISQDIKEYPVISYIDQASSSSKSNNIQRIAGSFYYSPKDKIKTVPGMSQVVLTYFASNRLKIINPSVPFKFTLNNCELKFGRYLIQTGVGCEDAFTFYKISEKIFLVQQAGSYNKLSIFFNKRKLRNLVDFWNKKQVTAVYEIPKEIKGVFDGEVFLCIYIDQPDGSLQSTIAIFEATDKGEIMKIFEDRLTDYVEVYSE